MAGKSKELCAPEVQRHRGWGGRRDGAGNNHKIGQFQGGTVNSLKNEVLTLRSKYGKMPLDHMLKVLNNDDFPDPPTPPKLPPARATDKERKEYESAAKKYEVALLKYEKARAHFIARQDWAAEHAAPYLHARLASIEITAPGPAVRREVDLTKLTNEELNNLEALVVKASKEPVEEVTLDEDQYHEVDQ
jgi:hypothetical protein